jgi:hypothetical protein
VPIEVGERTSLPKVLDTKRANAMTADRADPGKGRRVAIEHRHDAAMGRQIGEQALDMRTRMHKPALARSLRRGPAGVETVRRGDGEEAYVPAVLGHQSDGLDRFRRDRTGIGDYDLAVRPWFAQPVGAVDNCLAQLRRHIAPDLLHRTGGQA